MFNNSTITKSLTQYIKKNPEKFIECSTTIADRLIQRLPINLDSQDLKKISTVYQFIIMYSIVTSDLYLVIRLLNQITTIQTVVESIQSGSLRTTREKQISSCLLNFTLENSLILLNDQNLLLAGLYFNKTTYHEVIKIVHDGYLPQ